MSLDAANKRIFEYLRKSVKTDRLAHAYLFYGPEGSGKEQMAFEFIKMLYCSDKEKLPCGVCKNCQDIAKNSYPDVLMLSLDEGETSIPIDKIKKMRQLLSLHSYYGGYKSVLIFHAHNLTLEAANAFLKTLEEPRGDTIFVLTAVSPELLLETISSRVQLVRFPSLSRKQMIKLIQENCLEKRIQACFRMLQCPIHGRLKLVKTFETKEVLEKELKLYLLIFRDILLEKYKIPHVLFSDFSGNIAGRLARDYSFRKIINNIKLIQRLMFWNSISSINSKLAFEVLLLNL